jgi:hypothetical protein
VESLLDGLYGSRSHWKRKEPSTFLLGQTLQRLLQATGAEGIHLIETMRKGSDHWRPGRLITDAVRHLESAMHKPLHQLATYGRFDPLCPSLQLLNRFRLDPSMSFADYAFQYANELYLSDAVRLAAMECIVQNSMGIIPVFYCTDPYLKGYCNPQMALGPYMERNWNVALRNEGCHRVILCEELAAFILSNGFDVELYELDQMAAAGFHLRTFRANRGIEK